MRPSKIHPYIPVIFQNAIFSLLLFAPMTFKKTRHRMCYDSSFKMPWTQKSSRLKHSILKDYGYIPKFPGNASLVCSIVRCVIARNEATQGSELCPLGCFVPRNDAKVNSLRFSIFLYPICISC